MLGPGKFEFFALFVTALSNLQELNKIVSLLLYRRVWEVYSGQAAETSVSCAKLCVLSNLRSSLKFSFNSYSRPYSEKERERFKEVVFTNTLQSMQVRRFELGFLHTVRNA